MFGDKHNKVDRLQTIGVLLRSARGGLTQAELARLIGVNRSTINKDLAIIQDRTGTLLAEDDQGRLFWAGCQGEG
jgi:predicted DNA-binding transcriptional regulator YafY